mmetsp:Transcript_16703/g.57579  ORF Transcript_16703/g.57579 Transcript_16703/m.57579 type:complete len:331 (+) Transcript_16703:3964-4956(+)
MRMTQVADPKQRGSRNTTRARRWCASAPEPADAAGSATVAHKMTRRRLRTRSDRASSVRARTGALGPPVPWTASWRSRLALASLNDATDVPDWLPTLASSPRRVRDASSAVFSASAAASVISPATSSKSSSPPPPRRAARSSAANSCIFESPTLVSKKRGASPLFMADPSARQAASSSPSSSSHTNRSASGGSGSGAKRSAAGASGRGGGLSGIMGAGAGAPDLSASHWPLAAMASTYFLCASTALRSSAALSTLRAGGRQTSPSRPRNRARAMQKDPFMSLGPMPAPPRARLNVWPQMSSDVCEISPPTTRAASRAKTGARWQSARHHA